MTHKYILRKNYVTYIHTYFKKKGLAHENILKIEPAPNSICIQISHVLHTTDRQTC